MSQAWPQVLQVTTGSTLLRVWRQEIRRIYAITGLFLARHPLKEKHAYLGSTGVNVDKDRSQTVIHGLCRFLNGLLLLNQKNSPCGHSKTICVIDCSLQHFLFSR